MWTFLFIKKVSFAAIKYEVAEENTQAILRCPHSVTGKVTWWKEWNRKKIALPMPINGDMSHILVPDRRYFLLEDNSLTISKAGLSDTGRYYCNNEPVELIVTPRGNFKHYSSRSAFCFLFSKLCLWAKFFIFLNLW